MRYQFYREHKYVSAALNDLERLIAKTDFCNLTATNAVQESFHKLCEMLKDHAQYEEEHLHVLLANKNSTIHVAASQDHAKQKEQLDSIEQYFEKILLSHLQEDKLRLGYELYLTYRQFTASNLQHMNEEELEILPELQRLYTDDELRAVEAPTYHAMEPKEMVHMMEILFPHMNPTDHAAFLWDIHLCEPKKYTVALNGISSIFDITHEEASLTGI